MRVPRVPGEVGSAEYAHARMRARWGERADETAWHRIEITRELVPLLELVRASPALVRWVQGLTAGSGLHAIEHTLRRRWHAQVGEVAAWVGSEWQAAVHWCAWLIDLPVLAQRAREETLPDWAAGDALLGHVLGGDAERGPADADEGDLTELLHASRGRPERLLEGWLQAWHRRLPVGTASAALQRTLVPMLSAHAQAFASAPGGGWPARRALADRLVVLLRRHAAEPIEAFVYLALQALELERLRAEIVARAAFPRRSWHA
jgi:hypothetical protein